MIKYPSNKFQNMENAMKYIFDWITIIKLFIIVIIYSHANDLIFTQNQYLLAEKT